MYISNSRVCWCPFFNIITRPASPLLWVFGYSLVYSLGMLTETYSVRMAKIAFLVPPMKFLSQKFIVYNNELF